MRPHRVHLVLVIVFRLSDIRRRRGHRRRRRGRRHVRLRGRPGHEVWSAVRYEIGGRHAVDGRRRRRRRRQAGGGRSRLSRYRRRGRMVMVFFVHGRCGRAVRVRRRRRPHRHRLGRPVRALAVRPLRPLRHAAAARPREQHGRFRRVRQHGHLRRGQVVRATAAEHERVHAHADVPPVAVDALVHEHARALQAVHRARLLVDLVVCEKRVLKFKRSALNHPCGRFTFRRFALN